MNSTKKILNLQAITSLYGEIPPFGGFEIINIHLGRDEPMLLFNLMTTNKPKSCPKRWPETYDVVYIDLSFIGVSKLSLERWNHNNIIKRFTLEDNDNFVSIRVLCSNAALIAFCCEWIHIENITYGHIGTF
jgi:hypothetical protein